jgi:DNA-binding CsgD family transcriptional regulator
MIRCLSNKEIAGILRISHRTVKFHASNLFTKLRITNRRSLFEQIGVAEPHAAVHPFGGQA